MAYHVQPGRVLLFCLLFLAAFLTCQPKGKTMQPIFQVVDLDLNEKQQVVLPNGDIINLELKKLEETRDSLRNAVREAKATVAVDGQEVTLVSATYRLPVTIGKVQIDCPVTSGYTSNDSKGDSWGLDKAARFRVWPVASSWITPGTFVYPVKQKLFATATQFTNEPTWVDGGEDPGRKTIYYHLGVDFGGVDGVDRVVSATDGIVVSRGEEVLKGYENDTPIRPRADVIYIKDPRGWYIRYSHLDSFDPVLKLGKPVKMGQAVGILGKKGHSGGWAHLHFDISFKQPSGKWGITDAYPFAIQAYQDQYQPKIVALARPHHLIRAGSSVELNGEKSWSNAGDIVSYEWTFTDGKKEGGVKARRKYERPGEYNEILKVTDDKGNTAYDFMTVLVVDKQQPDKLPPTLHVAYYPTQNIKAGEPVTIYARCFKVTKSDEEVDFGDGSPAARIKSDGNVDHHAKPGYAKVEHTYRKPGDYIVRVERADDDGITGIQHAWIRIE